MDESVNGVRVEWRCAHKQLVDDDTKRPQIDCMIVWEFLNQFRSHIQRSSLNGSKNDSVCRHRTSETEITKFDDAVCRNQNVLRFHISVDDAMTV